MSHACAGSTPVPATSKVNIDAALQQLTDKKQQWVMQPCARRAELLRACVQQALLVRSLMSMFGGLLERQYYATFDLQWTLSESTMTGNSFSYRSKMKPWMRLLGSRVLTAQARQKRCKLQTLLACNCLWHSNVVCLVCVCVQVCVTGVARTHATLNKLNCKLSSSMVSQLGQRLAVNREFMLMPCGRNC